MSDPGITWLSAIILIHSSHLYFVDIMSDSLSSGNGLLDSKEFYLGLPDRFQAPCSDLMTFPGSEHSLSALV